MDRLKLHAHHNVEKVYSGINDLPSGSAPEGVIEGCAVLEGGAFRGVYGEGVLDALMQNGINMSCTIGVSAGAMNGLNYVASDIGRSARINLRYRHDPRYVGLRAIHGNHGLIGFDFAFKQLQSIDPLNMERFFDPARRFIAVATDCATGLPAYFEKGKCSDIFKAVQASASMPYVSAMVDIDGGKYLDGGCSKKVPYEWAISEGYEKIVIVRTQPLSYRKSGEVDKKARLFYRTHPEFAKSLSVSGIEYNRECDEMESLSKAGRVFMISPSRPIEASNMESDMEKLGGLYHMGYDDAVNAMGALKSYLGI